MGGGAGGAFPPYGSSGYSAPGYGYGLANSGIGYDGYGGKGDSFLGLKGCYDSPPYLPNRKHPGMSRQCMCGGDDHLAWKHVPRLFGGVHAGVSIRLDQIESSHQDPHPVGMVTDETVPHASQTAHTPPPEASLGIPFYLADHYETIPPPIVTVPPPIVTITNNTRLAEQEARQPYIGQTSMQPRLPHSKATTLSPPRPYAQRPARQFTPLGMTLTRAFEKLRDAGLIGHDTEHCATLHHAIQDLIDSGLVNLSGPSVTINPMPTHSTHAVHPPPNLQ
ncbi:hypothetical protein CK203_023531 [Vitis vinifera]|uniref:Uncharacterized protein n=1 Tax=Vitis vinifera TaxID=29760 RepID=A0A438JBW0_VITVI|nr:hypothetical protein CK203_023531 [Vitis vinifera]